MPVCFWFLAEGRNIVIDMASASEVGAYIGGVAVALLSTSTNATGLLLQKLTHKARENMPKPLPPVYKEVKWLGGLGCLFAGSLLSLAVFALLGQSRASAMAAITIAINAILATWFLGERFTRIDFATTALIGAGTTVSVVFGSSAGGPDINYDVDIIVNLLQRDIVYITTGVAAALFLFLFLFLRWTVKRTATRSVLESKLECFARALCAGIFSGSTGGWHARAAGCTWGVGRAAVGPPPPPPPHHQAHPLRSGARPPAPAPAPALTARLTWRDCVPAACCAMLLLAYACAATAHSSPASTSPRCRLFHQIGGGVRDQHVAPEGPLRSDAVAFLHPAAGAAM